MSDRGDPLIDLNVFSEIGALRAVLVHEPGAEVDVMPPSMMEELLFDDIIYGDRARREHARFRAVLQKLGAEVLDTGTLLGEAVEAAPEELRGLISDVARLEGLDLETVKRLDSLTPRDLARTLVHGLRTESGRDDPSALFRLPPLPNLLFSRDAQVVLGDQLLVSSMSRRARRREPLLSRFVFQHHPRLKTDRILLDFSRRERARPETVAPTIEGGDILVFREGVVIVGVSERTMELAVDLLAQKLRASKAFHTLIMVPMPRTRSAMHLDTIFTRISLEECLVYSPLVLPGSHETLSVVSIDLGRPDDWGSRRPGLLEALGRAGVELEPICCGGTKDYILQSREQWTDGANSFAAAPGVILTYSRNAATADELARFGYEVLDSRCMPFSEDGACEQEFVAGKKYAILVTGEELSRARGGPRCMTMPLVREPV